MLGAATKVAGVAGSRMSSAAGKAARHVSTNANLAIKRTANQVLAHDAQGKLLGQMHTGYQGDALRINQAWVEPEARGMGVYKKMLESMKDEAIEAGRPLVHGDVVNEDLQRKFQREGLLNVSSMSTQSDTPSYMRTLDMMRLERLPTVQPSRTPIANQALAELSAISSHRRTLELEMEMSAAIASDNVSAVWEELSSIGRAVSPPRVKPPPPPTADKSMLMQPRHSSARYGIPKRSRG